MNMKNISEIILEEILKISSSLNSFEEKVDRGFEGMEQKFAEIDLRFTDIDRRFDDINEKFKDVDNQFMEIRSVLTEIAEVNMYSGLKFDDVEDRLIKLETKRA